MNKYKPVCRCEDWSGEMDFKRYTAFGGWVWEIMRGDDDGEIH